MALFMAGVIVGALAYPIGLIVGEELSRRNGTTNGYAFGA